MDSLLGTRRRCSRGRVWTTLLSAILLSSAGYLDSLAWAQTCKSTKAAPIRVDNSTVLGTLRAAVNCTDGGLVKVIWTGAVILDLPIAIANGIFLHVTGEDDLAEVRGDDSKINGSRLFDVSPGGGLTLTGLKLSGGTAAEGGAIYSSSAALTLKNCTFENNSATDGSGGAVCANGGNITIMGGEFLGNKALKYGGAVHVTDGRLKVQGGSRFDANEALIGGALYCGPTSERSVTSPNVCSLNQTEFTSNRATKVARDGEEGETSSGGTLAEGGAIYSFSTTLTLDDCTFESNSATDGSGGAVLANGGRITIMGGEFLGNKALEYGGAVTVTDGRLEVQGGSRFEGNEASIGGALYCGPTAVGSATLPNVCSLIQAEFTLNRAAYADPAGDKSSASSGGTVAEGGAIYASSAILTLDHCTFQSNDADGSGGAVWANGGNITIMGGEFLENKAIQYGGAVHASDSRLEVQGGSRFKDNEASLGGGLFCGSTAVESATSHVLCSLFQTEFTSNRATYADADGDVSGSSSVGTVADGGAIYSSSAALTIENCTFQSNNATSGSGGAVWASGGNITIMGGAFLGNNALEYEGVKANDRRLEVRADPAIDDSSTSSGGAVADGGAIYVSSATLTLDNCTFQSNGADGNGGAVWANGGNITIMGGEFLRNKAIQYGGAVHASDTQLEVQGLCRFEDNEASVGGGLFCGSTAVESVTRHVLCSLFQTEFTSNRATFANPDDEEDRPADIYGGGAAAFHFTDATVTDSVFRGNYGHRSGGALFGGPSTNISVNRCKFGNNTSGLYGGAISASSMTLAGHTQMTNNSVPTSGGAVYGWDPTGTIVFNEVFCKDNSALVDGGCFQGWGKAIFNDGTVMLDNHSPHGGCIYADTGSTINVNGGTFTSRTSDRGGFLYAAKNTTVNITGGLFADNIGSRKGAALYCSGNGVSNISIEGGTFRNNSALESGGAIAVWGDDVLVSITGGTFENNTALLFGGFIFIEIRARISCEGATIRGNSAGEQGGGIYAREAHVVHSSCDLIANESPQGAAIYLTNVNSATFEDHNVTDNLASGGSVVYVAASTVVAKGVTLESSVGLQAYSSNRAIQLDEYSTLDAENCVFDGWLGDTVVLNLNSASGSLVLNSCDFSGSSAAMAVISPNSDAEIRNAVISNLTLKNAVDGTMKTPLTLVDRAMDCSDPNACGVWGCVNSLLGVLCECLEGGECQSDSGELSLSLKTRPENKTFSPNAVSYELLVSSAGNGTTFVIWNLAFEGCDLELDVVPSSGVMPTGSNATVTVTGTSTKLDVGGDQNCRFYLKPVGNSSSNSTNDIKLDVISAFYLCQAYEYAQPQQGNGVNGFSCEQCATISGEEGVDCESPGATRAWLPIRSGYWRSNSSSLVVRECLYLDACSGVTEIESADDYCADGYSGPYCAVCSDGYGSGVSNSCHNCNDTKAHVLLAMSALFCLVVLLIMFLAVVFLIGGLDAVDVVRKSFVRTMSLRSSAPGAAPSAPKAGLRGRSKSLGAIVSPAQSFALESKREVGSDSGGGRGTVSRSSSRIFPAKCSDADDTEWAFARPLDSDGSVRSAVELSDETGRYPSRNVGISAVPQARISAVTGSGVGGAHANTIVEAAAGGGGESHKHGFGHTVKRCVSRLPLDKLKILVVVWQILTAFSSITGVEFPASYARFLSWISFVNLDIGSIFAVSCVLPSVNFYASLLVATLAPLGLAAVLVLTYHIAKHRAGIGSFGVVARRAAWSRHVAAGLLLTFLVFTSASTAAFKTFACDDEAVEGKSYLRADYSVSCGTSLHTIFQVYAGFMILVYPIGIPVLYAVILWGNRELLNPRIRTKPDRADETDTQTDPARENELPSAAPSTSAKGQAKNIYSVQELQELEKKVKARRDNPQLVPSMFLWKDFGPDLYYYEVVECGRRILLTGLLIFIAPHTATQAAMACLFAFACLLGFELLRPHMDPADSWLYRLGCVVIFLSNFLALLIKVDAGEDSNRDAFGALVVAVNVLLVVAVLVTSWFAVQQTVDDSRDEESSFPLA